MLLISGGPAICRSFAVAIRAVFCASGEVQDQCEVYSGVFNYIHIHENLKALNKLIHPLNAFTRKT
jgi:hypothetical protein